MTAKRLTETQIKTIKNVRAFVKAFMTDDESIASAPGTFAALEIDGENPQILQTPDDFGIVDSNPFAFDDNNPTVLKQINWINESIVTILAGKTKQSRVVITSSFEVIRTVYETGIEFYDFVVEGTIDGTKFTLTIFDPASSYDDVLRTVSPVKTAPDPLDKYIDRDLQEKFPGSETCVPLKDVKIMVSGLGMASRDHYACYLYQNTGDDFVKDRHTKQFVAELIVNTFGGAWDIGAEDVVSAYVTEHRRDYSKTPYLTILAVVGTDTVLIQANPAIINE